MNAHGSALISQKLGIGSFIPGIAADQAMFAEKPEIAGPGDRRSSDIVGQKVIRISVCDLVLALDELIDLGRGKAGDGEVKVQLEREVELQQLLELEC